MCKKNTRESETCFKKTNLLKTPNYSFIRTILLLKKEGYKEKT